MRCSKARELISDALDARLDERGGLDLSHHLDGCPDCRRHQEVLERGQSLLRQDTVEPSANFEWKVQLKIQQALREKAAVDEPVGGWRFWRPALASATGVAAVVLVFGALVLPQTQNDPASDRGETLPAATLLAAERGPADDIASAVEAEPDLSGAVRGKPLRINAASGGFGIRTVADAGALLEAGADKVSVNTAAVDRPAILGEIAARFGVQCTVLAIDAAWREGRFEVLVKGGREGTGIDAIQWARDAVERGAGEILLTSWDRDGTRAGYDLELTRAISDAIRVPVIASGGAAGPAHLLEAFAAGADAVLAASIFHDDEMTVGEVKRWLLGQGVHLRP